jgi:putative lipase involved disintegration of autophagic bodies
MVTPQSIENRLLTLSKEVDDAHQFLETAEIDFHKAKSDYELAMAGSRLSYGKDKLRVQDVQDLALTTNSHLYRALNSAEAVVKAARANATRIRTQVDIARSVGTSVRSSLEL